MAAVLTGCGVEDIRCTLEPQPAADEVSPTSPAGFSKFLEFLPGTAGNGPTIAHPLFTLRPELDLPRSTLGHGGRVLSITESKCAEGV